MLQSITLFHRVAVALQDMVPLNKGMSVTVLGSDGSQMTLDKLDPVSLDGATSAPKSLVRWNVGK